MSLPCEFVFEWEPSLDIRYGDMILFRATLKVEGEERLVGFYGPVSREAWEHIRFNPIWVYMDMSLRRMARVLLNHYDEETA